MLFQILVINCLKQRLSFSYCFLALLRFKLFVSIVKILLELFEKWWLLGCTFWNESIVLLSLLSLLPIFAAALLALFGFLQQLLLTFLHLLLPFCSLQLFLLSFDFFLFFPLLFSKLCTLLPILLLLLHKLFILLDFLLLYLEHLRSWFPVSWDLIDTLIDIHQLSLDLARLIS